MFRKAVSRDQLRRDIWKAIKLAHIPTVKIHRSGQIRRANQETYDVSVNKYESSSDPHFYIKFHTPYRWYSDEEDKKMTGKEYLEINVV